jgi:FixJ family two-component response regulator
MNSKTSGDRPGALPTVHIIDDDDGIRAALALLLDTIGYRTMAFSTPAAFLEYLSPDISGCLLLDIRMPEMGGMELQQRLIRMGSPLPIIFMTGHGDVPMAVKAMKDGAFEFIQKPFREQDLLDRINRAIIHDTAARGSRLHQADIQRREASLTTRERQVMTFLVDGAANKAIAGHMSISERTVEIHRARVMDKMCVRSVAHLVKLQNGLPSA